MKTYQDRRTGRPAYRLETVLQTDGPSLRMTFFAKKKQHLGVAGQAVAGGPARACSSARRGGSASEWQLTNPTMLLFGDDDEADDCAAVEASAALYPIYPLTKGVDSWDLQRAIAFARTVLDDAPRPCPTRSASSYDVIDARTAYDWIHAPDDYDQVGAAQRRFRFEEALVTQLVLGRRRREVRALGRSGPQRRRRRAAGGVRRPAAVRAHRRTARDRRPDRARPRPAAPDEPAAPGRGGLRQDAGGAAGDAAHRRLRRPGRAAGADRGARPAAPPLDHRAAGRPGRGRHARRRRRGHEGRPADRLDDQGASARSRCCGSPAARPAS